MSELATHKNGRFAPGNTCSVGLGRPKGKRTIAYEIIHNLFDKYKDQFRNEMDKRAKQDIIKFYEDFVLPILPKNLNLDITETQKKELTLNLNRLNTKELEKLNELTDKTVPEPSGD